MKLNFQWENQKSLKTQKGRWSWMSERRENGKVKSKLVVRRHK